MVEIIVWVNNNKNEDDITSLRNGSKSLVIEIEKITKAILFPISMLAIKLDSSLEKIAIVLEINESEDLSNSNFNLFEEIKAISIPEKKAENKRVTITMVTVDIFYFSKLKTPLAFLISYSSKSGVDLNPTPLIISSSVCIVISASV